MCWRNKLLILVSLLAFWGCMEVPDKASTEPALLEVAELSAMGDENTLFIDFRKSEAYLAEHIPGALNLSRNAIENPSYAYGGMLADKDHMEKLLGNMGVTNEQQLVIYDDQGLPEAARMWWALKHYGFPDVKLINWGMQSWKEGGNPLESEPVKLIPSNYVFPSNPALGKLITKEELFELISSKEHSYVLVDTRSKDEYMGTRWKAGAAKAGRIPNSVNLDWSEAIHFDGNKKFKSLADLERIFARLGASKEDKIIVYCHSGVRSSHTYFVLTELLGYKNVLNYDGSWTEWSHTNYPYINELNTLVKN